MYDYIMHNSLCFTILHTVHSIHLLHVVLTISTKSAFT